ncbi:MAG: hypothetical protein ACRDIB_19645, partial [Ardenticatenaceae bacterium]
ERSRLPEPSRALDGASDEAVGRQIAFAQSAFSNIQELNRTMDQKANNLLSSVALLTAALSLVASRAVAVTVENDWQRFLRGTGIALVLLYLLVAFAVIFVATSIYQARGGRPTAGTTAPGMIFPLMLLKRYSVDGNADETAYLARLKTLQPDDVLQDYSNQIVEVAIIYGAKQKQVNFCLRLFRWTGILWLVTMLVVVVIIVMLP